MFTQALEQVQGLAQDGEPKRVASPPPASVQSFAAIETAASAVLRARRNGRADAGRLALEIWALAHGVATLMLGGYLPAQGGADAYRVLENGVRALVAGAQGPNAR
jgi:hypothetical protein